MLNDDNKTTGQAQDEDVFVHAERAIAEARAEVAKLEEKLRLARGTGDVTEQAAQVAEVKPRTLAQQVEDALRAQILTTDDLAKMLAVPAGKVFALIKEVRPKVHNLGTPERARWSWRPGDEASTKDLMILVERLISDTPMSFRDIIADTGAREGRIQGVLVEVRRAHPGQILDLGGPGKARWFMVPPGARDATLRRRRG